MSASESRGNGARSKRGKRASPRSKNIFALAALRLGKWLRVLGGAIVSLGWVLSDWALARL